MLPAEADDGFDSSFSDGCLQKNPNSTEVSRKTSKPYSGSDYFFMCRVSGYNNECLIDILIERGYIVFAVSSLQGFTLTFISCSQWQSNMVTAGVHVGGQTRLKNNKNKRSPL